MQLWCFFAKNHVYLPQCEMKLARFQGKDKLGDFIDNQHMTGNAFQLLNAADDFLRRHLPISSTFRKNDFKRLDKSALPVIAVREALINALCHKNYADLATDISLAIYDDRLEIWNSGLLPATITLESLKKSHDSILRNKLIANVFYVRDYIEKWGTGTNKIVDSCRDENVPEPDFSERIGGLVVTFWFSKSISSYTANSSKNVPLSERQQDILCFIKEHGDVSIQDIMTSLDRPPSQRMVQKDLQYLKNLGLVGIEGASRSIVWLIKGNES